MNPMNEVREIDWKREFIKFSLEYEELLEAYSKTKKREIELLSIISQHETFAKENNEYGIRNDGE